MRSHQPPIPTTTARKTHRTQEPTQPAQPIETFPPPSPPHPQNKRGGRVQLKSIVMPEMEFSHPEKGDALYGMELALSLEKVCVRACMGGRGAGAGAGGVACGALTWCCGRRARSRRRCLAYTMC